MKYLLLLGIILNTGCSVFSAKKMTWRQKKRECFSYYLNNFGLTADQAIKVCNEEMGRNK